MRRSEITIEQASDEGTGLLTLADLLNKRAACTPDRCAFIFLRDGENDEERITYGQLYNSALAISRELTEATRPGDRALMFYPAGLEFIKALFGCFTQESLQSRHTLPGKTVRLSGSGPWQAIPAPALCFQRTTSGKPANDHFQTPSNFKN